MTSDKSVNSAARPQTAAARMTAADITAAMNTYKGQINDYRKPDGNPLYTKGIINDDELPSDKFMLETTTGVIDLDFHHANNRYLNSLITESDAIVNALRARLTPDRLAELEKIPRANMTPEMKRDADLKIWVDGLQQPREKIGRLYDLIDMPAEKLHAYYWNSAKPAYIQAFLQTTDFLQKNNPAALEGINPQRLQNLQTAFKDATAVNRSIVPVQAVRQATTEMERFINTNLVGEGKPLAQAIPTNGNTGSREFIGAYTASLGHFMQELYKPENIKKFGLHEDKVHGPSLKFAAPPTEGKPVVTVAISLNRESSGYGLPYNPKTGKYYYLAQDNSNPEKPASVLREADSVYSDPRTGAPVFTTMNAAKGVFEPIAGAAPYMEPVNPATKALEIVAARDEPEHALGRFSILSQNFGRDVLGQIIDKISPLKSAAASPQPQAPDPLIVIKQAAHEIAASGILGKGKSLDFSKTAAEPADPAFIALTRQIFSTSQNLLRSGSAALLAGVPSKEMIVDGLNAHTEESIQAAQQQMANAKPTEKEAIKQHITAARSLIAAPDLQKKLEIAVRNNILLPEHAQAIEIQLALPGVIKGIAVTGQFDPDARLALKVIHDSMIDSTTGKIRPEYLASNFPVPAGFKTKEDYARQISTMVKALDAFHDAYQNLPEAQKEAVTKALKATDRKTAFNIEAQKPDENPTALASTGTQSKISGFNDLREEMGVNEPAPAFAGTTSGPAFKGPVV